jgi:hypothetical protein
VLNLYLHRTSADLFKTAFDLMVSVTLFVGRFDMRMMQVNFLSPALLSAYLHIFVSKYSFSQSTFYILL